MIKKKKNPFPGVTCIFDRHGRRRYRFRKNGASRYLHGEYGSKEFRLEYECAISQSAKLTKVISVYKKYHTSWLIEAYLKSSEYKANREVTRLTKRREMEWIKNLVGDLDFRAMKRNHVEKMMAKKDGATAANKVKKNITILFNFAKRAEIYEGGNPASTAAKWKVQGSGYHTWKEWEIRKFLQVHGPGTKAHRMLLVLLATGASRKDAAGFGPQNCLAGRISYTRSKTDTEVDLPIVSELQKEIDSLPEGTNFFVARNDGGRYTTESFGNLFADYCAEAGLGHCSAHGLRKAGATRMAERGATVMEIMAFLGHQTEKEAQTYVKAANRKILANEGLARLSSRSKIQVSNLSLGLDMWDAESAQIEGDASCKWQPVGK
jgi:integrase